MLIRALVVQCQWVPMLQQHQRIASPVPTQVVTADRPSAHLSAADDSEKKTKLHSRMNDRHQFPARPDPPSLAIFRDLALELYISDHESVLGDVCCCFPSFSSPNSVPRVIMPFPLIPVRRWDEFCSKIRRVFWCGLQGGVRPHLSVSLLGWVQGMLAC